MTSDPTYLFSASDKPSLEILKVPLIYATEDSVQGYGCLVDDQAKFDIEIVTWPASGWRPVDEHTGNEGGTVEGVFSTQWEGGANGKK